MMLTTQFERIRLPAGPRPRPTMGRLWREWCFFKAAVWHFRGRFLLLLVLLVGGGLLFKYLEPEKVHTLPRAIYYTWALIFGEQPEAFPRSPVLQGMFFVVPVLGGGIVGSMTIADELVVVQRWVVEQGGPLCDRTVGEVLREHTLATVERRSHGGVRLLPPPDTPLEAGDTLLLQGTLDCLAALRRQGSGAPAAAGGSQ
jgi:hypothetical protein